MSTYLQELFTVHALDMTEQHLQPLSSKQLTTFCGLLGIPTSGSRHSKTKRILLVLPIRFYLKPYVEMTKPHDNMSYHKAAGAMARNFTGPTRKGWCAALKLYQSPSKVGRAHVLLKWGAECRRKGQDYYRMHVSDRYVQALNEQPSLWQQR